MILCCGGDEGSPVTKTAYGEDFKQRLDRLTDEIVQPKSMLVYQAHPDSKQAGAAGRDLMKDSEDISTLWFGPSLAEEIRTQRER